MFSCIINRNFSRTLTSVFACLFAVFLGSIFATYMKIFTTIKKALSLGLSATTEQKPSNEIEQEEDVKLDSSKESEKKSNNLTLALSISKGFFINFTFVALSIGPFFVASVFDFDKTWPAYAHLYPYVFFRLYLRESYHLSTVSFVFLERLQKRVRTCRLLEEKKKCEKEV